MTTTSVAAPTFDDDPFCHEILEDPLPFQHALREAGPVAWLSRYDVFAVSRYSEVHEALIDWQSLQSAAGVGLANFRTEKPWRAPSLLLEADPPRHDAPRRVLKKILSPGALRKLRESWAADADDLVSKLLAGHAPGSAVEIDAVSALAEAFPLRVFPDAVGIPDEGRHHLLPYGDHLFNTFGPPNDLVAKGAPMVVELSAWTNSQCARDVLAPEGFGADIWAAADRGEITTTQAPLIVRSLLSAGVDTTVHGLSATMYAFTTNPREWDRLRAEPGLARVAFDEAVRWESPVQTFFRTATRDLTIGGHEILDGNKIVMFLGAANRDPRHWGPTADRFDLLRDPSGHVGFGMGIHQCVGQHVARLEAESLLGALARRVARIEPAGPARRHHNNTLRAWESIPVRLHLG